MIRTQQRAVDGDAGTYVGGPLVRSGQPALGLTPRPRLDRAMTRWLSQHTPASAGNPASPAGQAAGAARTVTNRAVWTMAVRLPVEQLAQKVAGGFDSLTAHRAEYDALVKK